MQGHVSDICHLILFELPKRGPSQISGKYLGCQVGYPIPREQPVWVSWWLDSV